MVGVSVALLVNEDWVAFLHGVSFLFHFCLGAMVVRTGYSSAS